MAIIDVAISRLIASRLDVLHTKITLSEATGISKGPSVWRRNWNWQLSTVWWIYL